MLEEKIAKPLKLDLARSRRRRVENHQRQNGRSDQSGLLGARLRYPRFHPGRLRRRRADACRHEWRSIWAFRRCSCRSRRACTRRLGLLMSDVKHDYVRSKLVGLDDLDLTEINHMFHQLIERAKADLQSEGFQRRRDQDRALSRSALRRPGLRADRALLDAAARPSMILMLMRSASTPCTSRTPATKPRPSRWSW